MDVEDMAESLIEAKHLDLGLAEKFKSQVTKLLAKVQEDVCNSNYKNY